MRFGASRHRWRGGVLFWFAVAALGVEAAGFWLRASQLQASSAETPTLTSPPSLASPPPTVTPTTAGAVVGQSPASTVPAGIGPPVQRPGSVTYTLPAGTTLTVTATVDCWVEARAGAGGKVLSAGTLLAGRSEQFVTPVWIRFGNPGSVKVTVGGVALQMTPDAPGDLIAGP